jgi:L-ascorbate metabolism protein UlaG (beta-lactamase superfamily)
MNIQRLGWAGIKIEVGDTTVFVDAISSAGRVEATTANIHALVTHHHPDHCDVAALSKVFQPMSTLVAHADVVPWLDTKNIRVKAAHLFEPTLIGFPAGQILAFAVPAVDGLGHPQVSWVIDVNGKRVIHCGDTLWHGHWWRVARAYGPFEIAFMPVNAPRRVMGIYKDSGFPIVMTPEQAAAATMLLEAKMVCPIHYGKNRPPGLVPPSYIEDADVEERFLVAARDRKLDVKLMENEEWLEF